MWERNDFRVVWVWGELGAWLWEGKGFEGVFVSRVVEGRLVKN